VVAFRAVALAAALCAAAVSSAAAQVTSPALFDPDLTVGAGATLITTAGAALARAEDPVIPHRLFGELGGLRRSANITYRLLKLSSFDWPQEHVLLVFNHEVYGHGGRLRELFDGPIEYRFSPPPPYGSGAASTSFVFDSEPTANELLAVHAGGMEADGVAAALMAHQAFSRQRIRPRDALRYLFFEFDTMTYVWSTNRAGENSGHDVTAFLDTYNDLATLTASSPLTVRTLRREALAGLANPMLAYAVAAVGWYVATGAPELTVPSLSIGGVRYLPMVRYWLTPYGSEWSLVNELGGRIRPTTIELRVGRAPQATPWGIGVRQRGLASWRKWSADASLQVWHQPRLALAPGEQPTTDARAGMLVRASLERPLIPVWFSDQRATLIADAIVKTDGFVPGEPLEGGIVLRGGFGLPFGP
jgi:hypothetical protein